VLFADGYPEHAQPSFQRGVFHFWRLAAGIVHGGAPDLFLASRVDVVEVGHTGVMEHFELRFGPTIWAALSAAVMLVVAQIGLVPFSTVGEQTGLFIGVIGIAIVAVGFVDLRSTGTTASAKDPSEATELVTKGLFRFTRNPMYLGGAVILLAFGIVLNDMVATVLGVGLYVYTLTQVQIIPEERALAKKFKKNYAAYCEGPRRWL